MSSSTVSLQNSPPVAVFSYCMSSILMVLTNKYVLSSVKGFNFNMILLAVQSFTCLAIIVPMKAAKIIDFRPFNTQDGKKWFPNAFLLVLMIWTGSKAMQLLPVPVYTIFKNLTIILIAYGEVLWFNGSITPMIAFSFVLMVLSSVVAAYADVQNSAAALTETSAVAFNTGYIWMMLNCFSNAGFVLYMRSRIDKNAFSDLDTMYYNNLLSIPVLLIGSLLFEDWSAANILNNFPPETRNITVLVMVISGVMSVGISYCSGWCLRVTSSTTYSMVGALNKLPIALTGLLFFGDAVTFFSVSAILLGFAAGLVYSSAKIQQKKEKEAKLPTSKTNQ